MAATHNVKYALQDLIDMEHFQNLQDRLNEIYSFPSSIIDNEGNILTATAWQDVCTRFHRKNKESEHHCIQSDQYILSHLHEANPAVTYRCPHGLVDNATPIIIDGIHYGNFFTGQFFLEEPDMEFFRAQAKKYGFDEGPYLEAVKRVPVWTQEQLNSYLFFIKGLITVISESGLKKLKEVEARKQIEESEERFRILFESAPVGIALVDLDFRVKRANQAYCEILGYNEEELKALTLTDITHPEDLEENLILQRKLGRGEIPSYQMEKRYIRKDGNARWGILISSLVKNEKDEPLYFIGQFVDISDHKKGEEALRESEERYRILFNSANDAVLVHQPNPEGKPGKFIEANDVACQRYGYTREELLDLTPPDLATSERKEDSRLHLKRMISEGHSVFEIIHRTKKGKEFPVEISAHLFDLHGKPTVLSMPI